MLEVVRSLLEGSRTVVHECRECGRTVDGGTDRCPTCDTESIASYRVE